MLRVASAFRWILAVVMVALLVAMMGWLHTSQTIWLAEAADAIVQRPWFSSAALALVGLTAGAWLDWALRGFDDRRAAVRTAVGIELATLGKALESRQNLSGWPDSAKDIMPRLIAALQATSRLRIWTPDMTITTWPRGGVFLYTYLNHVGTLLGTGQFRRAKQQAKRFRDILNKELPDSRKDAATGTNLPAQ